MAITVPNHEGPREAVLVLKSFRAVGGQEFMAGWTCGFHPSVVEDLVRRGLAKRVAQPVALPSPTTEQDTAESAVTGGDTAAAPVAASDAATAPEPTEKRPTPKRKTKE